MIIVTEKRALKKNPSAACCLLLSNLWNRSCISFHMCRFFANCTLLLLYPQKREGKWENKINALQLSISWLDLIMRICSIMSNVQKWFCNTQTFFGLSRFLYDDSSLQNYYTCAHTQKKWRNSCWQKSWQITFVLRHFWHYSRSKDK